MVKSMFEPRPIQWGLRGDPRLWSAMEVTMEQQDLSEIVDIEEHLRALYAELVGQPLTDSDDAVAVERFDVQGGISSGLVSPKFWRETGIPLLVSRYQRSPLKRLWWNLESKTFYDIPEDAVLSEGDGRIWSLSGGSRLVDLDALALMTLSGEDAGRLIGRAMMDAPVAARLQLQRLMARAQEEHGHRIDMAGLRAGAEAFLERLQGFTTTPSEASPEDTDPASDAPPRRPDLKASLGMLGRHLQRLGQRLQDMVEDDPPAEDEPPRQG